MGEVLLSVDNNAFIKEMNLLRKEDRPFKCIVLVEMVSKITQLLICAQVTVL